MHAATHHIAQLVVHIHQRASLPHNMQPKPCGNKPTSCTKTRAHEPHPNTLTMQGSMWPPPAISAGTDALDSTRMGCMHSHTFSSHFRPTAGDAHLPLLTAVVTHRSYDVVLPWLIACTTGQTSSRKQVGECSRVQEKAAQKKVSGQSKHDKVVLTGCTAKNTSTVQSTASSQT
jgi:hypothetical protein